MAALVWLLIPLAGAMVAAAWSTWATRRSNGAGGVGDVQGVAGYEAFRQAMEQPRPADRTAARADG
ncbi:hypothetical protein GCM10009716_12470 [Streptomyces sodiiphilus]|uniref:Uncharacterized protein n=1 Tax=Streptomyces sodiiphilus TaxID=226217 RepID=A0ABN2NZH4_9ACTN